MSAQPPSGRFTTFRGRDLGGGAAIAGAIVLMNLCTYGFTIVAARWLGPGSYGAFAALMGLLLVVGVVQLGLQATAARRIAASPEHVAEIESSIMGVAYRAGLAVALVCLLAAPMIDAALRLDSLGTAALVALAALPTTVLGAQLGILQGERRWVPLALMYLANGLPRILVGVLLIMASPTAATAMWSVVVAQFVPVLLGWWLLRAPRRARVRSGDHSARQLLTETMHNSHALLAFFALSNVDVLVARNIFDSQNAGLYAGGLIATKAVLFLPQFVVVIAFPSMSRDALPGRALYVSLGLVTVVGAACAAAAAVLSSVALLFVGGEKYADIEDRLWQFAALGTLLALLQLLTYGVVARQSRRSVFLIWAALAVVAVLGLAADSIGDLLGIVLVVDLVLVAGLVTTAVSEPRRASSARSRPRRPAAR